MQLMGETLEERQARLLSTEDWRFHAVGPGGTGLIMIATSEKLSGFKTVNFGLPSAPALFLRMAKAAHDRRSSVDLATLFANAEGKPWPDNHTRLFDYLEDAICETIFSFTAIEAYANEMIPKDYTYSHKKNKRADAVDLKGSEIERAVSLDEKLKIVLPKILSLKTIGGTALWEKFKRIKSHRDRLIHLKTIDREASGPEDQTIWGFMLNDKRRNYAYDAALIIDAYRQSDRRWLKTFLDSFKSASSTAPN